MNYNTVYVGMDVHKESFSLCCYTNEKEQAEYPQKVDAHYSKVLNYLEAMRFHYGDDVMFICGYEAGCLGFTLYHQLTSHNVKCIILAPTTMSKPTALIVNIVVSIFYIFYVSPRVSRIGLRCQW